MKKAGSVTEMRVRERETDLQGTSKEGPGHKDSSLVASSDVINFRVRGFKEGGRMFFGRDFMVCLRAGATECSGCSQVSDITRSEGKDSRKGWACRGFMDDG